MRGFFLSIILIIALLIGCSDGEIKNRDYLLLTGESENWYVKDYELELTADTLQAGNGQVIWKGEGELETDSFQVSAHAIINQEDRVMQRTSFTGDSKIKEHATGAIEGGTFLNEEGEPITRDDIEIIYL